MNIDAMELMFGEIQDVRRKGGNLKHKLSDILIMSLVAVMSGCRNFNAFERYCDARSAFFKEFLDLPNGIPDADTFRRVLERISPEEFQKHLAIAKDVLKDKWQVIAIDGKTMRGSVSANRDPYHVVSAWVKEKSLTLGQVTVDNKSNEIKVIPKLLDLIDVTGDVVTIDAMGCQKEIAQKIVEKNADYVLAVKGNQKELYDAIKDYFENNRETVYLTQEKGHGRIEKREYTLCTDSDFIKWLSEDKWAKLTAVGKVKSTVTCRGKTSVVERYYITTLTDTKKFAESVRGHWSIESMHWMLDVVFGEDTSRARKDHSAQNMNILRKTALTLLKQCTMDKPRLSMQCKMISICLNPAKYFHYLID